MKVIMKRRNCDQKSQDDAMKRTKKVRKELDLVRYHQCSHYDIDGSHDMKDQ